jgi:hypothetical protein
MVHAPMKPIPATIPEAMRAGSALKPAETMAKTHDELARGQKHVRRNSPVQTNQKGITDSEEKLLIIMPQALPYPTHEF